MMKKITLFTIFSFLSIHTLFSQDIQVPDVPPGPHAEIEFTHDEFNFGTIVQGEIVKNVFEFTNTSDVPLIITNAKGSCGCTVPEWPREPILPGESSYLLVQFNSKGKKGTQAKRVTITANTEIPVTHLYLKGTVEIEPRKEDTNLKNQTVNENFFTIMPNPTSELVYIKMEDYVGEKAIIEIFDRSGQIMTQQVIDRIEKRPYSIDLTRYAAGVYTATVIVGDKMRLAKQFVVL